MLERTEARVDLGDLGGPGDRERLVGAVVAPLGQHARQRLPGLGLAVQVGQHRAQALGARRLAQGAFEAGDRAMALPRRHVGAGQAGGDFAPCLAFGHRQAAVQPLGGRQRVARGERQPAERVERLGAGIQAGGVLPRRHRPAGVRERAFDQARRLRPQRRRRRRLRAVLQDPGLAFENVREYPPVCPWRRGRPPACATSDRVRVAHPGSPAGPRARCCAARAARRDERFQAQRETALANPPAPIELGDPQPDGIGEPAVGFVETRQRFARRFVVGRLLVQRPPDPDCAGPVVQGALGQLAARRNQPHRRSSSSRSRRAVEQQRGRPVRAAPGFPTRTCTARSRRWRRRPRPRRPSGRPRGPRGPADSRRDCTAARAARWRAPRRPARSTRSRPPHARSPGCRAARPPGASAYRRADDWDGGAATPPGAAASRRDGGRPRAPGRTRRPRHPCPGSGRPGRWRCARADRGGRTRPGRARRRRRSPARSPRRGSRRARGPATRTAASAPLSRASGVVFASTSRLAASANRPSRTRVRTRLRLGSSRSGVSARAAA